jgi:hypothetical protein
MATKTAVDEKSPELNDLVVNKIVELGCACPPDLAGQIGAGVKADDLIPVLKSLVDKGILRRKEKDPDDEREYKGEYQTVYELAGRRSSN